MPTTKFQNLTLTISLIVLGIMAGFFWTYTINVNRAMLQVDGKTYAVVQSLFNQNVRHSMFFSFYFGGVLAPLIAIVANWKSYKTAPFWLMVAAFAVYLGGVFIYTSMVNLPLNEITEAWDPANVPSDWTTIRQAWNDANAFRTIMAFIAFVANALALMFRANQAS